MIDGFPHEPPTDDHFYEEVCFKRNVIAIHLVYRPGYLFNDHNPHRTIWGFYNTKKQQFHVSTAGDGVRHQGHNSVHCNAVESGTS